MVGPLQKVFSELKQQEGLNPFWDAWLVDDPQGLKKLYNQGDFVNLLRSLDNFLGHIELLATALDELSRMQDARAVKGKRR